MGARKVLIRLGLVVLILGIAGVTSWFMFYKVDAMEQQARNFWGRPFGEKYAARARRVAIAEMFKWDMIVGGVGAVLIITGLIIPRNKQD